MIRLTRLNRHDLTAHGHREFKPVKPCGHFSFIVRHFASNPRKCLAGVAHVITFQRDIVRLYLHSISDSRNHLDDVQVLRWCNGDAPSLVQGMWICKGKISRPWRIVEVIPARLYVENACTAWVMLIE
jgi:hypothetical protein